MTFGGYLGAGSSSVQLTDLVDKWFLGMDHPTLTTSGSYSKVSGNLFGAGGPSYTDVYQGALGDCTVLASLAETAARTNIISSMFTANGNNTWTVRFYHAGSPVYVTVDNQLPGGGGLYDHPHNNVLWPALAEKAYAELNQEGWLGTLSPGTNSYKALDNGNASTMVAALGAFTGRSASSIAVNPTNIASALSSGKLVVIGTGNTVSNKDIEHNHCYAVVGYNASAAQPFTVFNPWGMAGGYDGSNFIWGQFTANAAALSAYFVSGASTSSMPTVATASPIPFVTHVAAPLSSFSPAAGPVSHADAAFASLPAPGMLVPAVEVAADPERSSPVRGSGAARPALRPGCGPVDGRNVSSDQQDMEIAWSAKVCHETTE